MNPQIYWMRATCLKIILPICSAKNSKKRCSKSLNTTRLSIICLVGVAMATASSFFASSLGKAPAFFRVPLPDRAFVSGPKARKTAAGSQQKHSSEVSCTEQRGAINRAENSSRYLTCFKKNSGCTSRTTKFATHSRCSNGTFESL